MSDLVAQLSTTEPPRTTLVEPWAFVAFFLAIPLLVLGMLMPPKLGMGHPPVSHMFHYWVQTMFVALAGTGFIAVGRMLVRGVPHPLKEIKGALNRQRLVSLIAGAFLVALIMTAFGIIKPMLGRLGFSADPFLARIDNLILGSQAWRVFEWARHPFIGEAYHAVWLFWLFTTVVVVLWRSPSLDKSRMLIVFFLLWTVIGPVIHMVLPAAGPVIAAALSGYTVVGLEVVPSDAQKFNYLLSGHLTGQFNPGGGISAMPSLHIATMAWTVWVWRGAARWIAVALTIYMWIASVALGWHYLVDGAVGLGVIAGAVAILPSRHHRQSMDD